MDSLAIYLKKTPTLDWDNSAIGAFVDKYVSKNMNQQEAAIALYYPVRDLFRYDPYRIELTIDGLKASRTLSLGYGWCVSKAILLAACCRYAGIPARLGYGDVFNHMTSKRLREAMKTDLFYWHGYTDIYLNNRWIKATPAFNLSLCEKIGILPLEFDGENDSIFQPFDSAGNKYMEYVNDRGTYADVPLDDIRVTFHEHYSGMLFDKSVADFGSDVVKDTEPAANGAD